MTNTLGIILKDQNADRGEKEIPIQRLPITGLALPPLGALHELNCLSHKLGDGPRLIVLSYVKLKVTSRLSFFSRGLPKGVPHKFTLSGTSHPPDSRRMKKKSYLQCFTFDFFSMAVIKLGLLLKQYHPKSPVSLEALWIVCRRLNAHAKQKQPQIVVNSCTINNYTFWGRLIYGGIRLEDHEGIPGRQKALLLEGKPL
ncbi:LOW QUALITY PROTEIN: hypothetical protein Cgig2_019847 [Carnegiea gigantea]|uniref:Uncharacterized protein n=1 Tax=Carnegiea gigantea TaxID=171969 RepID=A0A9Q1JTZ7_9CARY|nr:LOW QUALITY PROTEIN: hypothetical protein Cgig2_019847 [Carnegiea gigantea]